MKNSMKKVLTVKLSFVLGAFLMTLLFSLGALFATRASIRKMNEAEQLHTNAVEAERAHYAWAEGLCSAVGLGTEFQGTLDYKSCALGKYLYSAEARTNQEVAELVEEIIPVHQRVHETAGTIDFSGGGQESAEVYLEKIRPDIDSLVALLDEVIAVSEKQAAGAEKFTQTLLVVSVIILLVLAGIAFMGTVDAIKYMKLRITEPIRVIEKDARRLQHGELNYSIEVDTDNEVGQLAESLTDSIRELSAYVNEIGRVLNAYASGDFTVNCEVEFRGEFVRLKEFLDHMQASLKEAFGRIDQNTAVVLSASGQVACGAQELAESVEEQANIIAELSGKMGELLTSVNEDAESSRKAAEIVSSIRLKMADSTEQTRILDGAMDEIRARSHEISKVVKTIEDIASQTNMLSLNASIEASRAGEAGRGFAVVADQIRDLAAKSAQASQDTTGLIAETIRSVDNGSEIAQKMAECIGETNRDTAQVIDTVHMISESTQFQAEAIRELTEGIGRIHDGIYASSATSEESAAASEEMKGLANSLDELVKKFRFQ